MGYIYDSKMLLVIHWPYVDQSVFLQRGRICANLFMLFLLLNLMTTWPGLVGEGVDIGRPQTFWKGSWFRDGGGKSVFRHIISDV